MTEPRSETAEIACPDCGGEFALRDMPGVESIVAARVAEAWATAAALAETCETGTHAASVIRFTARSVAQAMSSPPGATR